MLRNCNDGLTSGGKSLVSPPRAIFKVNMAYSGTTNKISS